MFEAVVTICLGLGGTPCHDQLLPGVSATDRAACTAALAGAVLPDGAQDPRCVPAGEALAVRKIAPGVFAHLGQVAEPDAGNRGDVANLGFVIGADSVAVIDSGGARWIGEALWRAIRAETDLPVSHVILTHMHPDHIFGAGPFVAAGAIVVGHARLGRGMADRRANYSDSMARLIGDAFAGSDIVPVDMAVADNARIDLGGRVLDLRAWDTAHTGNDLTVLDSATGTLFAGDLVFHLHTPALDGSLRGWRAALDDLAAMAVRQVVPGHGGPVLDWPRGVADTRRYLEVLARDTRAALARGDRLGAAVQVIATEEAPLWQLFDAYNARNATVAFTELEWE